ncbi:MAG: NifU family protein [Pseudomonadota bacterium]
MFIQTEETPNPATMKFLPGKPVLASGMREFNTAEEAAAASPLAARLFAVNGVESVFLAWDFVSVTKEQATPWPHLRPAVLGAIMEHYLSGDPVISDGETATNAPAAEEFYDEGDENIVLTIKELLDTRVRPAVAQDGGDIAFQGFREGIVYLHMRGACAGCPSSTATLKMGIENLLKHFIPEVNEVRPIGQ